MDKSRALDSREFLSHSAKIPILQALQNPAASDEQADRPRMEKLKQPRFVQSVRHAAIIIFRILSVSARQKSLSNEFYRCAIVLDIIHENCSLHDDLRDGILLHASNATSQTAVQTHS